MSNYTGTIPALGSLHAPTASELAEYTNALTALTDGWSSYSPTFTNLTVGNGVFAGVSYKQLGKTIQYRGRFTWGSTTSATASATLLSMPVTAADVNQTGSALLYDTSAGNPGHLSGICQTSTTSLLQFMSPTGQVISTVPMTWAVNDILQWAITYEAA